MYYICSKDILPTRLNAIQSRNKEVSIHTSKRLIRMVQVAILSDQALKNFPWHTIPTSGRSTSTVYTARAVFERANSPHICVLVWLKDVIFRMYADCPHFKEHYYIIFFKDPTD